MNEITRKIQEVMEQSDYKAKTVSIARLPEVQEAVGELVRQGLVSKQLHEKWSFYLDTNKDRPETQTIVIVAIPQPITRVRFEWQGTDHPADIAPSSIVKADESHVEELLNKVMKDAGYKVVRAHLALKTLAVRSGLAQYGRNNISYVPGMGSFLRLIAFYTDCPCEDDNWQEVEAMKACENCSLCRENCPTGSITDNRFLIHAEKCLGSLSEREPDFPYWVHHQPDWPNALIGCISCQSVCPVNKPYLQKIVDRPHFSEEETGLILSKTPWDELPPDTRQKLEFSESNYPLLTSNLGALIEKQNKIVGR
ncbi:MAG: hypothetical protein JSV77_00760 [Dehalococcoidales bacterium]|nr:MAG: hypothetical protein JSV77_00760 [Dehalococcoidales bacterium]